MYEENMSAHWIVNEYVSHNIYNIHVTLYCGSQTSEHEGNKLILACFSYDKCQSLQDRIPGNVGTDFTSKLLKIHVFIVPIELNSNI